MNKINNVFVAVCLVVSVGSSLSCSKADDAAAAAASDAAGGGGGSGGGGGTTTKAVASSWTNSTGLSLVLDLSNAVLDGSTTFTALLTYGGTTCSYQLQMSATQGIASNCNVTAIPVFSGSGGISSSDCTTNAYNICGNGGVTGLGEYDWDGNGLSFAGNALQFR